MNKDLLDQIIKHIFSLLLIIPSSFVNDKTSKSLKSNNYLLDNEIFFEDNEDGNKIWGATLSLNDAEIKLILLDCDNDEYCLLVKLTDAPVYCLYYSPNIDYISMAFITNNNWIICNTFLQASFLAAMEKVREFNFSWSKCSTIDEEYKLLISFINYYNSMLEEDA